MCNKCGVTKCICKTVISRRGVTGRQGKNGAKGKDGVAPAGLMVVGQSAFWGGISGPVGQAPTGTLFSNLESNFFNVAPYFYVISVGLNVTAGAQHDIKAYFKKNGVQVGQTYEKTMFPKDHLIFSTQLIQFVQGDFLDLYIESSADDCEVSPFHLIHYRQ